MKEYIIVALAIYVTTLLLFAYFLSKKSKSPTDFILGGRSTNYWVTAIALQASDMSHWAFLAFPGIIYTFGLFRIWELIGVAIFMLLNWQFVAPKLRKQTEKFKALTLFSYFEKRFQDNSGIIRLTSALIALLFFIFFISSGLVALGRVFEYTFGLDYTIGVLVSLSTIVAYTILGGFSGVAWCDFFQGIFAISMLLLVAIVGYIKVDGWQTIAYAAKMKSVSLSILPSFKSILKIPMLLLIWGPGYFGQPQLLSFFMGIKDPKNIKYAKYTGIFCMALTMGASVFIGLIGLAFFHNGPNELIYVGLTKSFFPPLIAGFVLCAIVAATLTTLDSYILVSGSVIAEDIEKKILKKEACPKRMIWLSRIGSIFVSIIALLISLKSDKSIYYLINYAWSGMGSAFGPLVLASLHSKKVNKYGAISGILVGAITSAIWPYINTRIFPIIPGFMLSLIAIIIVSYATNNKTKN